VLQAVPVRVSRAALIEYRNASARVDLTSSAGFYVRAFAHSLGQYTGAGACLEALQRTRSGAFSLDVALPLEALSDPQQVNTSLIPLDALLPDVPAVLLSERGRMYVTHGREIGPDDYTEGRPSSDWVRLVDQSGALVALANPGRASGSLHPSVVLI
jgi:tRNA pseudouridine55 synthase